MPSPMGVILTLLCDMFNSMIENVILPLFPARKHISKERKYTQNNFPSNPWYDKECKSLKYVVNDIAKRTAWRIYYNVTTIQAINPKKEKTITASKPW